MTMWSLRRPGWRSTENPVLQYFPPKDNTLATAGVPPGIKDLVFVVGCGEALDLEKIVGKICDRFQCKRAAVPGNDVLDAVESVRVIGV